MEASSSISVDESVSGGMFANPTENIFISGEHVGSVYVWDDGFKNIVWFDGVRPKGLLEYKIRADKVSEWQKPLMKSN